MLSERGRRKRKNWQRTGARITFRTHGGILQQHPAFALCVPAICKIDSPERETGSRCPLTNSRPPFLISQHFQTATATTTASSRLRAFLTYTIYNRTHAIYNI